MGGVPWNAVFRVTLTLQLLEGKAKVSQQSNSPPPKKKMEKKRRKERGHEARKGVMLGYPGSWREGSG